MRKKLLAMLLAIALLVSAMSLSAFAAKEDGGSQEETDSTGAEVTESGGPVNFVDENGDLDQMNNYLSESMVADNGDGTYTIFLLLTDDASDYIASVSYDGEVLTVNGGGYYMITVDSIDTLIPITFTIAKGGGFDSTVYMSITIDADSDTEGEDTGADSEEDAGLVVTIPAGLADGTYSGDAMVEPDDDDGFNFYYITVAVTIADGAVESFSVTGATGSNTQYSYRAETGINEQLAGATAGSYTVDVVAMATCSSKAIVEGINAAFESDPTDTSYELGDAVYDPDGTQVTLTIHNPEADTDYSDITIAYAVGKFSSELTAGTDYTVEPVSSDESAIVYTITILPNDFEIEDDDLTHSGNYNALGMNLDVTVAGSSAGRISITSGAVVTLRNNTLRLTGGNGETLSDYIEGIDEVTIAYADADGNAVSETYSTQWQHDTEPEYTPDDIFNGDGSVNLDCGIFALGSDAVYTITLSASGFDDLTAQVGSDPSYQFADDDASGTWAWAAGYIYDCYDAEIINGYSDGTFDADGSLTRAAAAKIIAEALGLTSDAESSSFSDVSGHWALQYIEACAEAGIINGYTDGSFRPDETVTRAELAKMIAAAMGYDLTGSTSSFTDVSDSSWALPYIEACVEAGVINGLGNGLFAPDNEVTRAQAAKMIAVAIGLAD